MGARVIHGMFAGRGNITFLAHEFFAAGGSVSFPTIRRAIRLIHESVHAFGNGWGNAFKGGSRELTSVIVQNCFPALAGKFGGID